MKNSYFFYYAVVWKLQLLSHECSVSVAELASDLASPAVRRGFSFTA